MMRGANGFDKAGHGTNAVPCLVLVHGSFHGSWCWDRVVTTLESGGIPVQTVELPFTGFADDVAELGRVLDRITGPSVVCGHSYGGRVVDATVSGRRDVVHLIYLAALLLDAAQRARFSSSVANRRPVEFSELDFESVRSRYYHDCPEEDARAAFARFRPLASRPRGVEGMGTEPWRQIASTYIRCTADRVIDPALQQEMATNATYCVEIDSGHSPFLSRPRELASVLAEVCVEGRPTGRRSTCDEREADGAPPRAAR